MGLSHFYHHSIIDKKEIFKKSKANPYEMERPEITFFAMLFVLLFAVIGFIFVVFDLRSILFVFQLAILLSFMFFLAFGMFLAFSDKNSSWSIIAAVLVLMLFDVFIIMLFTRRFNISYAVTVVSALLGLLVALVKIVTQRRAEKPADEIVVYDKSKYYYPYSENAEQIKEDLKQEVKEEAKSELKEEVKQEVKSELRREQNVKATYTPGKFVGSEKGNKFHLPKCVWAANIKKENQVWFDSEEEAIRRGYKKHNCSV